MEEIALVISSLAGACTAVALDKIPRQRFGKQNVTVNSTIENQLHSLRIEKEILAKTITRLHQEESNISRIQRDKLLTSYQHQLGTIFAKIEKLEIASKYPDFGPVGDSLITLMDTKLSKLDQKLYEISSKISVNTLQQPTTFPTQIQSSQQVKQEHKQIEPQKPRIEKVEIKTEFQKEKAHTTTPVADITIPERHVAVELSTLTEIPNKMPEFPAEFIKPPPQVETVKTIEETATKLVEPLQIVPVELTPPIQKVETASIETPKPVEPAEKKIQIPSPLKIPEEEKIEDDDKDLDKIKSEIMKALSKLEQVEVE